MADGTIALDEPAVTDKLLDTESLTVGANTVQRERMRIAGAAAADLAPVSGTDGLLVNLGSNNDVTVTSGTVTANLGSVDNAVLDSIDAATTAIQTAVEGTLTVDGSGVTQPISAASLPLPTGAATAAKQPALGTAGTASSDVLTVQGIASMTPLKVDGSDVTQPVSDAGGSLTVDGTVAATQSGTWTVGLNAGTNAIGKLAANSGVDIGDVDVTSQPARAATTDTITAKLATDAIQNGTTALTPKFAVISASTSGNNTLVAAVTSKKIRVLAYNFIANGTVNAKFQSGAGGTDLTGLKYCVANSGICAPFNPVGWFETAANTLLNLNLSAAIAVGGELVYVEV